MDVLDNIQKNSRLTRKTNIYEHVYDSYASFKY